MLSQKKKKKKIRFGKAQKKDNFTNKPRHIIKKFVYNFSTFNLPQEKINAFSHGINHHIPTKITKNFIVTEF